MKKINQKGAIDLLLVAVLVIVLAVGGFVYYRINSAEDSKENETPVTVNQESEKNTSSKEELGSTEILELDPAITLSSVDDLTKLPEKTPETFTKTLESLLADNTPDDQGCITEYEIFKISKINVAAGASNTSADPSVDTCGGGVAIFWYIDADNETWKSLTTQNVVTCEELDKTTLTSEFVEECFVSNESPLQTNPNGSIKDYKYSE